MNEPSEPVDPADASPRVLVVDDDVRLRTLVERYLREQGFAVSGAGDARQAEQQLQRRHVDVVVLDVMMPGEDGLSFCRRLRAQDERVAIIMLTARGDEVDRIVGLEIGADDYLAKPGSPRELLARIRAVLRRRSTPGAAVPKPEVGAVQFGRCTLDHTRRVLVREGVEHRLTSGEFALLSVLVRHPGQPLSRDRLMSLAHGRDHEPFERSVDVTVSRLRRVIEDDPKRPRHLQTVWGQGYVFVAE